MKLAEAVRIGAGIAVRYDGDERLCVLYSVAKNGKRERLVIAKDRIGYLWRDLDPAMAPIYADWVPGEVRWYERLQYRLWRWGRLQRLKWKRRFRHDLRRRSLSLDNR